MGFTAPKQSRPAFRALVLAVCEGKTWRYVGHVGTGFSHAILESLHAKMLPLRTTASPFTNRVGDDAAMRRTLACRCQLGLCVIAQRSS